MDYIIDHHHAQYCHDIIITSLYSNSITSSLLEEGLPGVPDGVPGYSPHAKQDHQHQREVEREGGGGGQGEEEGGP